MEAGQPAGGLAGGKARGAANRLLSHASHRRLEEVKGTKKCLSFLPAAGQWREVVEGSE